MKLTQSGILLTSPIATTLKDERRCFDMVPVSREKNVHDFQHHRVVDDLGMSWRCARLPKWDQAQGVSRSDMSQQHR